ncbi:ABC-three component system middle component 6 [Liquorilactobacillus capillatus]|uniref:ABC-three component system middle component 6 n=1 Tax=Liquorilactobacillus capillatus TaxID=480931 RepID=UPI0007109454|nr:ABC-three component system middle component 6 [Liquorilactobacillus capillatus]
MFNKIDPKLSPYYVGAFSLSIIRQYSQLSFQEWFELVEQKISFKIGEKLFTLSLAWLYILGQIDEQGGRYIYVHH